MFTRTVLAAALGLTLAIAGCGGDDEAKSPVPTTSTKTGSKTDAWVTAANDRCLAYQRDAVALRAKLEGENATPQEAIERSLDEVVPLIEDLVIDLRALDVPDDVQADWDTFLDGYSDMIDFLPELLDEKIAGIESPEMRARVTAVGRKIRPIAETYAIDPCAGAIIS